MALLARILAPHLSGAEMEDSGQSVFMPALEDALVEKAAPKRRREFALGRACARAALKELGYGDAVIGKSANGAPIWPDGIIGSITHTASYAAALVGEARHFSGIGMDAERVGGVTQDLWPRLFTALERDHLMSLDDVDQSVVATLIFSAKEACYKAWGGVGTLAFRDIQVTPDRHGFTAVRGRECLQGRHVVAADLMLTAVWF